MNSRLLWAAAAAALAAALSSCGGGGSGAVTGSAQSAKAPVEQPALVQRVEPYEQPAGARSPVARQQTTAAKASRPDPFKVRLPPVAANPLNLRRGPGIPVQVGTARDIAVTSSRQAMSRALQWRQSAGGAAAAVSFTSEGAGAIRLGLLVRRLPAAAVVRGYPQGGELAFEIPAADILEAIRRNRDAGDMSDAARTWWTPLVDGEQVTLEIWLPAGVAVDGVDVAVPRLSHLQVRAQDLNNTAKIGQAASCEVDVKCVNDIDNASRSTARMVFTAAGSSYVCTGTLLNDSSSSGTPYFLSANHCISSQTVASSLNTYWFYRASACNSGILDPTYRVLRSGATLLYTSGDTDTSFMKLVGTPPAGVVFSGWSLEQPALGLPVGTVHHPEGDVQKYSQGSISAFGNCGGVDATDSFSCSSANAPDASFVNADWQSGTTEAGSSGAALFAGSGASRYLIGQLYGGSASCTFRSGTSWYGRFDKAYYGALARWLSPSGSPQDVVQRTAVYRFYNATTGAHFFTPSSAERDWVIAAIPSFNYEGVAFYAYGSQVTGSTPVYRFYNSQTGRHFYTMSPIERDIVAASPGYTLEGPSWYAQEVAGGAAFAIYRFNRPGTDIHFYTISAAEKDFVVQNDPSWTLEGTAYYAWTTQ